MADLVKPSRSALAEALVLSEEILKNLELGELPLTSIAFKAGRLARLINDFVFLRIMEYEAGGYPSEHAEYRRKYMSWQCWRDESTTK